MARYTQNSPDGAAVNVVTATFTQPAGSVVYFATPTAAGHKPSRYTRQRVHFSDGR